LLNSNKSAYTLRSISSTSPFLADAPPSSGNNAPAYRPPQKTQRYVKPGQSEKEHTKELYSTVFKNIGQVAQVNERLTEHSQREALKRERYVHQVRRHEKLQVRATEVAKKNERRQQLEQVFRAQKTRAVLEKERWRTDK
jgi:hypothetical protein